MYWDRDLLNAMAVLICCEILKNRKTIEHLYQQLALLVLVKIIVACVSDCYRLLVLFSLLSSIYRYGCVVLFTGWFHRCIRLESSDASL